MEFRFSNFWSFTLSPFRLFTAAMGGSGGAPALSLPSSPSPVLSYPSSRPPSVPPSVFAPPPAPFPPPTAPPSLSPSTFPSRPPMLQEEAFRLRKESTFHDANLQWREMKFWLDQLTSYSQQASIVLGFAFASFCADNLGTMPWETRPLLSGLFVFASALAMTTAISVVAFSSHLMLSAERLAMTTAVRVAAAAVRSRLLIVIVLYVTSLVSLFVAAVCLVFSMCDNHIIRNNIDHEADWAERNTEEHQVSTHGPRHPFGKRERGWPPGCALTPHTRNLSTQ